MKSPIPQLAVLVWCVGCGLSPISNRIEVGKNPFVVFVGEGIDNSTDLFAVETGGGRIYQLTFSPVVELHPAIVPDGSMLAFLRMKDTLPNTPHEIVVMNLVAGSEQHLDIPEDAGNPLAIAWSDDAAWLYVATERGRWRVAAPSRPAAAERIGEDDLATADSILGAWAGRPRFAQIITCRAGGACLIPPNGDTVSIAPTGQGAFAWGADSVAWFENDELVVRSLGAGTPRKLTWKLPPAHPREAAYAGK